MPKYELVDLNNNFAWIRYIDHSYQVDFRHEQEFIDFFSPKNHEPL